MFMKVLKHFCFSSRELMLILTRDGPNKLSNEEARSIVLDICKKHDHDFDKKFTYTGN